MIDKLFKYILFSFCCFFVLSFINLTNVHAIALTTDFYLNNALMTSTIKKYTAGNVNINLSIRSNANSVLDNKMPQYGYIALCSAFGSKEDRYINTVSSSVVSDLAIVNSTVGCTIPTTNSYRNISRAIYITFKIPYSKYDCGVGSGVCDWSSNLNIAFYQPGSNEYSLISYGFANEPYNFNNTIDPKVIQNDTIINQNEQQIDQNRQINDNIQENTDTLNNSDTSQATKDASKFFSGFKTDTFGLTSIITSPLKLIGSITNGECSPVGVPVPFVDKTLNLPCLSTIYNNYFGSLFQIYQMITFGFVAYWVSIRIFNLVKDFKNPDHDEIEVFDL